MTMSLNNNYVVVPRGMISTVFVFCIASAVFLVVGAAGKKEQEKDLNSIVSYSSCLIAASRALESERPDALVVDPLASLFSGNAIQERRTRAQRDSGADTTWRIAIRTRYFDDFIRTFLVEHKTQTGVQVVHLGAGMDSRSFRLVTGIEDDEDDSVVFYDVDNADVLELKARLLTEALTNDAVIRSELCSMIKKGNRRRKVVMCNIEDPEWHCKLREQGFDSSKPTCWVLEGLTYYLKNEATVASIFHTMHSMSCSGSCLVVSVASKGSVERAQSSKSELLKSWRWGIDEPDTFLSSPKCGGWHCSPKDVVPLGDEKANYGRFPSDRMGERSGIVYVTASY